VSGTTGMRTELKREEIAKMFELVEEKRPATEEQAKYALTAVRKLFAEKKLVIEPEKI